MQIETIAFLTRGRLTATERAVRLLLARSVGSINIAAVMGFSFPIRDAQPV